MTRVLFVCLGNICRSPMADALFVHKVKEAGLEGEIFADSAGTGEWHIGEPAHPKTLEILARNGIDYNGRARKFKAEDHRQFDYILTMDEFNLRDVRGTGSGTAKVMPMLEFAPDLGFTEVPDPYMDGRYELVYKLLDEATTNLLAYIRTEKGL